MKKAAVITVKKPFLTLDDMDVAGKRVLVRMDMNVPMIAGRVTDNTRVVRLLPTIRELLKRKAKVIILSHLGRPEGTYVPSLSLSPLVDALSDVLRGVTIKFGVDCVGREASAAVAALKAGEILLLENLRFHAEEEKNTPAFAKALAAHGDVFINDAFSCSHRSHASIVGLAKHLPFAAGRLMEEELVNLEGLFVDSKAPLTAIVGGSKVSTKLELLENLIHKVDNLIIGGAMANTFLFAQGYAVGSSLCEVNMKQTVLRILAKAEKENCAIHLPVDVVIAGSLAPQAASDVVSVAKIPAKAMILDVGPETLRQFSECLGASKTLVWNGPLGAFETSPFDASTIMLARSVASLTKMGKLKSIAGGGDTVAALTHAGLAERFSYISTAGGAFLEWMEGKTLPGVAALHKAA